MMPSPENFQQSIRVRWADCDAAKIAYTGRLLYFALEAIDAWWESVVDADWYETNIDRNIGLPFVHMSMDFKSPVTCRAPLVCSVSLKKLGESSVRFFVSATQGRICCFTGEFVEVYVNASEHKVTKIPEWFRARLTKALIVVLNNN